MNSVFRSFSFWFMSFGNFSLSSCGLRLLHTSSLTLGPFSSSVVLLCYGGCGSTACWRGGCLAAYVVMDWPSRCWCCSFFLSFGFGFCFTSITACPVRESLAARWCWNGFQLCFFKSYKEWRLCSLLSCGHEFQSGLC